MSVVVVACGLALVHLPLFFSSFFLFSFPPQTLCCKFRPHKGRVRDGEVRLIHLFVVISPHNLPTVCYPPPPHMDSLSHSLSHHENQVDGNSLGGSWQKLFSKRNMCPLVIIWGCINFTYLFTPF